MCGFNISTPSSIIDWVCCSIVLPSPRWQISTAPRLTSHLTHVTPLHTEPKLYCSWTAAALPALSPTINLSQFVETFFQHSCLKKSMCVSVCECDMLSTLRGYAAPLWPQTGTAGVLNQSQAASADTPDLWSSQQLPALNVGTVKRMKSHIQHLVWPLPHEWPQGLSKPTKCRQRPLLAAKLTAK